MSADTEPDAAERAALGAALAASDGPLILPRGEWDALRGLLGRLARMLGVDPTRPRSPREVLQQCLTILAEHENAITWDTTCTSCARVLDRAYDETCRAERAEAALAAERNRIAEVAETLGAHYHDGASKGAPFAAYLRGQSATTTQQQGAKQ